MPFARNRLVSQGATPIYHVVRRGVRRQYLGGLNLGLSRKSRTDGYGIRERLFNLSEIFANKGCIQIKKIKQAGHTRPALRCHARSACRDSDRYTSFGICSNKG